jgi:hypothetical protein
MLISTGDQEALHPHPREFSAQGAQAFGPIHEQFLTKYCAFVAWLPVDACA